MGSRHVGDVLALVGQGLRLGVEFGTHSLEALLWVAETVEESVYEPRSLVRRPDGIAFALDNPPLRVGAFAAITVSVNGAVVPGDAVLFRAGRETEWRPASRVTSSEPLFLGPGTRTEFRLRGDFGSGDAELTVHLELHEPAIPPRVWFEFTEVPRPGS